MGPDGRDTPEPAVGVVLAGGSASRLGGAKATADLAGRPLISYQLAAFAEAGIDAVVAAKPDSRLPPLDVQVIREPAEPTHPLLGICTALEHAAGRAIVTCPCDMPFVTAATLKRLAGTAGPAVIQCGDRIQPLLARFEPVNLDALRLALDEGTSATAAALALSPSNIEIDASEAFNVNTPEDLAYAASIVTRAL